MRIHDCTEDSVCTLESGCCHLSYKLEYTENLNENNNRSPRDLAKFNWLGFAPVEYAKMPFYFLRIWQEKAGSVTFKCTLVVSSTCNTFDHGWNRSFVLVLNRINIIIVNCGFVSQFSASWNMNLRLFRASKSRRHDVVVARCTSLQPHPSWKAVWLGGECATSSDGLSFGDIYSKRRLDSIKLHKLRNLPSRKNVIT